MKHLLFVSTLLVIFFSCKKEITPVQNSNALLTEIKIHLKDNMVENDFQQLDFIHTSIINYKQHGFLIVRIPFGNKNRRTDFVVLKILSDEKFSTGRIIHIDKDKEAGSSKSGIKFNGNLFIYSLNRNLLTESRIEDGYIVAFNLQKNIQSLVTNVAVVPYTTLPDVVVVASYSSGYDGWTYSDWINFTSFFNNGDEGGGGFGGYYSDMGGGGGGGGGTPEEQQPILIDYEPAEDLTPIDIKKYLQCFSNIPDAGATCSIKILTDIPVDNDPNAFFAWENNSPGHTFIQISKINGSESVQQNIGFYPVQGWKTLLTPAPVAGKFVDNFEHEFNASLTMNLTPEQLQSTLTHIQYLANFIKYDIDDYNCTDFALDVFNYKRGGNQITIPKYSIPGGAAPYGTATPQGLYQKLIEMKKPGGAESSNITIPGVKGYAGKSNGPCN